MRLHGILIVAAASALALLAAPSLPALGQNGPPAIQGYPSNVDIGALITNTLKTPGTVLGVPSIDNTRWRGVTCASQGTASSGSPKEVFSIEGFDTATNSWYQIATTGDITYYPTGTFTPATLTVYPGVATSSLSSGNVAQNAVLPRKWRVKDVVAAGTGAKGPALTSKIGCNYLD